MDSSSSSKQKHEFLDRTSRATRGKRMTRLLDDEVEEDELFWNQDALKEEEHDVEYEEEGEAVDVFDSDFDEDEQEPDAEEAEKEPEERKRKKLTYPGNPSSKKKKNKVFSKSVVATQMKEEPEESTHVEHHGVLEEIQEEKIVRKSTRTSVVVRQAEREAIREAVQATARPIKRKKVGEEKKMTQEEMLLEAAQTEIMNLRNLERVLAREEEVKKRAIVHKAIYSGPQIRYLSRNGDSFLEFINGSSFDSDISTTSTPYPEKALCAVTGLPAKYRDPKTGLPYTNKEAFKFIRERFAKENNGRSKQEKNTEILPSEPGFLKKGKRSVIPRNHGETSRTRHFARFRRIPAIEIDISD